MLATRFALVGTTVSLSLIAFAQVAAAQTVEPRFCGRHCQEVDFWELPAALEAAATAVGCERFELSAIRVAVLDTNNDGRHEAIVRLKCEAEIAFHFVVVTQAETHARVVNVFEGWELWAFRTTRPSEPMRLLLRDSPASRSLASLTWRDGAFEPVDPNEPRDTSATAREPALPVLPVSRGACGGSVVSDVRCDAWDHTAQPSTWSSRHIP